MGTSGKGRVDLGTTIAATTGWQLWPGGPGLFMVESSDFNGGVVWLEMDGVGTYPLEVTGTRVTKNSAVQFLLPGCRVRLNLEGAPAALAAWATHVGS